MPPVELIVISRKFCGKMLNGGEYLFSGCEKQTDFLIYM